jgi:hypothetical protein
MTVDLNLTYSKAQVQVFFPKESERFPKFTIVTKGRRAGLTKGAANAFIEYGLDDSFHFLPKGDIFLLWGDTISTNIDRYFDRYFYPILKELPQSIWKWEGTKKILKVGRATIDFRSADRPENWEGFGYHLIFLNEAGIILEDDYLYDNAVLPMLIDFKDAKLIAGGVPKGKVSKTGQHKFYKLYNEAVTANPDYRHFQLTARDNPFISFEELQNIAKGLDQMTIDQEIEGLFIDANAKSFLYAFDSKKHVIPEYKLNPHLPILVSFDFNVDPMTAILSQQLDVKSCTVFDEFVLPNSSTPELCDAIIAKYHRWMGKFEITGDASGNARQAFERGGVSHYTKIKETFDVATYQFKVRRQNMSHINSRIVCNSVLQNANFAITENCKMTIDDAIQTRVDGFGKIIKTKEKGAHLFDNIRYTIDACFPDWIDKPELYE